MTVDLLIVSSEVTIGVKTLQYQFQHLLVLNINNNMDKNIYNHLLHRAIQGVKSAIDY